MKKQMALAVTFWICLVAAAQNTYTVSSGTNIVTLGGINLVFGDGILANQGTLIDNNGTIIFTGAVNFSGTGITSLNNLVINHSAATSVLNSPIDVTGLLSPISGTLNANGYLTLKSTSINKTALVDIATGAITGNVTIERFIPAGGKRAFRFLSPAVNTSTTIKDNWQEGINNTSALYSQNQDLSPGYGTHITGSTIGLNGFDATLTGNPSLYTYNGTSWLSIANTNATNLFAGVGYRLLVRGNRAYDMSQTVPLMANTATTLRTKGTLLTGTINMSSSNGSSPVQLSQNNGAFSFIGNPYAAPIDWHAVRSNSGTANIGATYYSWDPTIAGSNQRGKYVAYNQITGMNDDGTSAIGRYIQPGQAFFVQNTGANPSLQILETNKAVVQPLTSVFRTSHNIQGRLWVRLYLKSEFANKGMHADGVGIAFSNDFSKKLGDDDSEKLLNPDESISIISNNKNLAITGLPIPSIADTVQLNINNILAKDYVLQVEAKDFNFNTNAYLEDLYTGDKTKIDVARSVTMPYSITADSASFYPKRFRLVFDNDAVNNLVNSLDMSVFPNPAKSFVLVKWLPINGSAVTVKVYNNSGQIFYVKQIENVTQSSLKIDISKWSSGLYYINYECKDVIKTRKFIKE